MKTPPQASAWSIEFEYDGFRYPIDSQYESRGSALVFLNHISKAFKIPGARWFLVHTSTHVDCEEVV